MTVPCFEDRDEAVLRLDIVIPVVLVLLQGRVLMSTSTIQQKFEDPETWKRIGLIALFSVIFFLLARWLIWVLVVVQLLFVLFAGQPPQTLSKLCADLSKFMHRSLLFITWTSNELPYPISESGGGQASKVPRREPDVGDTPL